MTVLYLNHFDRPYPRDARGDVQHYLGFVNAYSRGSVGLYQARQRYHQAGRGSRLLAAVAAKGIGWRTVRVWWDGDKTLERKLKRQRNLPRLCPICRGKRSRLRAPYWIWSLDTDRGTR